MFIPFIESYNSGLATPNPDVYCNRYIKFNRLRQYILNDLGFDYMATGHYARLTPQFNDERNQDVDHEKQIDQEVSLLRGIDSFKDQSYFLSTTPVQIKIFSIYSIFFLFLFDSI